MSNFVFPSDQARADSEELDRVCSYLEELMDLSEENARLQSEIDAFRRKSGQPVGAPLPAGWELEKDTANSITVHHPDIGCYVARDTNDASVGSIILFHLAN